MFFRSSPFWKRCRILCIICLGKIFYAKNNHVDLLTIMNIVFVKYSYVRKNSSLSYFSYYPCYSCILVVISPFSISYFSLTQKLLYEKHRLHNELSITVMLLYTITQTQYITRRFCQIRMPLLFCISVRFVRISRKQSLNSIDHT